MTLFNLLNLASPFDRRPIPVDPFYLGILCPSPADIGATVKQIATGQFWDGKAWAAAEPAPTLMARDANPAATDFRSVSVPITAAWTPGDYEVRYFELKADGTADRMACVVRETIPEAGPSVTISYPVAGRGK